jgi:hypothetical protein
MDVLPQQKPVAFLPFLFVCHEMSSVIVTDAPCIFGRTKKHPKKVFLWMCAGAKIALMKNNVSNVLVMFQKNQRKYSGVS